MYACGVTSYTCSGVPKCKVSLPSEPLRQGCYRFGGCVCMMYCVNWSWVCRECSGTSGLKKLKEDNSSIMQHLK